MHRLGWAATAIICSCAGAAAAAGPRVDNPFPVSETPLIEIHHKPGHRGGPPWMRGGRDRNDSWERGYRQGYADRYTQSRSRCRTTYRSYYDPYFGDYVSRPVRVCN